MRRRPARAPKKRIFLGCEGDSEVSYGRFLNELLQRSNAPYVIATENLGIGAGDPVTRLYRAAQMIDRQTDARGAFHRRFALLDDDQVANDEPRRRQAEAIAAEHRIRIIWQRPCHEAFLLRHFPRHTTRQPATTALALAAVQDVWPDYRKGLAAARIAERLTLPQVQAVAAVEDGLAELLRVVGLLPPPR